jgi:hypothetical protein
MVLASAKMAKVEYLRLIDQPLYILSSQPHKREASSSGLMKKLRREFSFLFSYKRFSRPKRVKTPPTEWWNVTIHRYRAKNGGVHDFIF